MFLNPLGILGLLALIPLLIFYLVKPKPEEQVMPSMRFFRQDEGKSQVRSAFRKILRNLVLILHIFIIAGFALAFAEPYIQGFETPANTVIILDRSASMHGEIQNSQEFIESRLGERNTLILTDSEIEVKAERAQPSRIREILERIKTVDTETDIASALDRAKTYEGRLVIASDLDQTVDDRNIPEILDSQVSKPVEIMQTSEKNSWGITDMNIRQNTTQAEIQNFKETGTELTVSANSNERRIQLDAGEAILADFQNKKGENTIQLPEDSMSSDNTARYVIPDRGKTEIDYTGPENKYFLKAVELIETVQLQENSRNSGSAHIIVLAGDRTGEENNSEIRQKVRRGGSAVVFRNSNALEQVFKFNKSSKTRNTSVSITYPQNIDLGRTSFIDRGIKEGFNLSQPGSAVKIHEYGEGKVLAYNINDEDFRTNFLYPVFWKSVFSRLSDRPTVEELNLETGDVVKSSRLEAPDGRRYEGEIEVNQTGFYTSDRSSYAVNLLSQDESSPDEPSYTASTNNELKQVDESLQNFAIFLITGLILVEVSYLWYRGDL